VWSFLAEADVAVVPSRLDESFGNTLVEAVLAGRPAVAADHTGLREVGAELASVVLVANDDSSAIADALARIADEWSRYRVAASDDARRLRDKIGPERYHTDVYRALAAAAGS
jgi:glycosyltransferase involved in cell wall biosynthesis